MICSHYPSQLLGSVKRILPFLLLLAGSVATNGACSITSGDATGQVGLAFTYQITVANGNPTSYGATNLPPGLTVNTSTGAISGTPTAGGTYTVTLSATYNGGCGTITKPVTFTIIAPAFVGFRLPDFLMSAGSPNNPRLMLQIGANGTSTTANRFNATLEVDASGNGTAWVPYNHFVGITDTNPNYAFRNSWITDTPLPIRDSGAPSGAPQPFSPAQLTQPQLPGVYMKADPRSTRFGIFQMDTNPTTNSRIVLSLWPSGDANVPNGFGGAVGTSFPGPVEHAPSRFSGSAYYPATFCINSSTTDARDNATTAYADNDGVTRPADAIYPGAATTTGSSTPYYTTSTSYHPIMLNRPFRNVAELGYVFRDLPWKTLDFFTDKSADAGLLDIFTINDGSQVLNSSGNIVGMAPPITVAGQVNLNSVYLDPTNSALAPVTQPVLAGAIWDEISSSTVMATGSGQQTAQTMTSNIAAATSATRIQNKAELITRAGLPTTILPTASNDNQAVKARREVVARTVSSVSQTRVWNVLIDVVAQSGRFKPNATSLQNDFIVEGEQHYWVHVAIDRFTGQVIDKQIEVVNE
jgi:Putative Ig domain